MAHIRKDYQAEEILKVIGNNIRKIRKQLKYTQLDLAVKINSHVTQISRIERGQHNLGIQTLEKIAFALKVSIHDLIPGNLENGLESNKS